MVDLKKRRVKRFSVRGLLFVLVFGVVIVYLIFFSGLIKKDCKQDEECFNKVLSECKASKFIKLAENNFYEYKINGNKGSLCSMDIKLLKMGVGTPFDLVQKLEGKSMKCSIPINVLANQNFDEVGSLMNYCSGPLKEGILELIIDRMYGLIIKNIGEIAIEAREDLFSIK